MLRPLSVRLATRYLGALHRWLYRRSGGKIGGTLWGLPVVLLTTTGRTTGRARTVPLCSLRDGADFVVIASYGGLEQSPSWWLNLQRNRSSFVEIGRDRFSVTARETEGAERERLWDAVTATAPGYLAYQARTTRRIPVVVLTRASAELEPGAAPSEL